VFEPHFEIIHRMGESPLIEDASGHRRNCSRGRRIATLQLTFKQPCFEALRRRVFFDGALQQFALDTESNRIGSLIAFAASPAAIGRFERGE
jgi:hypothetical protein